MKYRSLDSYKLAKVSFWLWIAALTITLIIGIILVNVSS